MTPEPNATPAEDEKTPNAEHTALAARIAKLEAAVAPLASLEAKIARLDKVAQGAIARYAVMLLLIAIAAWITRHGIVITVPQ